MSFLLSCLQVLNGAAKSIKLRFICSNDLLFNRLYSNNQWGSKKQHRKVKININWNIMGDPETEIKLAPLRERVKQQVCMIGYG